jgi:hypothetical protein
MPVRRRAWTSWNYITRSSPSAQNVNHVCLYPHLLSSNNRTYSMNSLQHIPEDTFGPVLVTLNPLFPPDPSKTHGTWEYSHPLFTAKVPRTPTSLTGSLLHRRSDCMRLIQTEFRLWVLGPVTVSTRMGLRPGFGLRKSWGRMSPLRSWMHDVSAGKRTQCHIGLQRYSC